MKNIFQLIFYYTTKHRKIIQFLGIHFPKENYFPVAFLSYVNKFILFIGIYNHHVLPIAHDLYGVLKYVLRSKNCCPKI
jgi:hypothetical protein